MRSRFNHRLGLSFKRRIRKTESFFFYTRWILCLLLVGPLMACSLYSSQGRQDFEGRVTTYGRSAYFLTCTPASQFENSFLEQEKRTIEVYPPFKLSYQEKTPTSDHFVITVEKTSTSQEVCFFDFQNEALWTHEKENFINFLLENR